MRSFLCRMRRQAIKRLTAFTLSVSYYGLFGVADMILRLNVPTRLFFIFLCCFEYLGLEYFFCIGENKTAEFGHFEFFICTAFAPLVLYTFITAGAVRVGDAEGDFPALCALCVCAFRVIKQLFDNITHRK